VEQGNDAEWILRVSAQLAQRPSIKYSDGLKHAPGYRYHPSPQCCWRPKLRRWRVEWVGFKDLACEVLVEESTTAWPQSTATHLPFAMKPMPRFYLS